MAKSRLTKQQSRRIKENLTNRQNKSSPDNHDQHDGLVVAHHGKKLIVEDNQQQRVQCTARRNIGDVVCGDRVHWQVDGHGGGVITTVLSRSSLLVRPGFADKIKPVAANITLICIVIAVEPEPQEGMIDRYLVAAENLGITPLLVFNKADLLPENELSNWLDRFSIYQAIGYELVETSSKTTNGLDTLLNKLTDNASILVGQSGVGKSSLINSIIPDLSLKVQELSDHITQGQHTTSHSELYKLPESDGHIIDSPGVRDFRLGHLDKPAIENGFVEFRPYIGQCKFSDCSHQHEPECALQQAVADEEISRQRLERYLDIVNN